MIYTAVSLDFLDPPDQMLAVPVIDRGARGLQSVDCSQPFTLIREIGHAFGQWGHTFDLGYGDR